MKKKEIPYLFGQISKIYLINEKTTKLSLKEIKYAATCLRAHNSVGCKHEKIHSKNLHLMYADVQLGHFKSMTNCYSILTGRVTDNDRSL